MWEHVWITNPLGVRKSAKHRAESEMAKFTRDYPEFLASTMTLTLITLHIRVLKFRNNTLRKVRGKFAFYHIVFLIVADLETYYCQIHHLDGNFQILFSQGRYRFRSCHTFCWHWFGCSWMEITCRLPRVTYSAGIFNHWLEIVQSSRITSDQTSVNKMYDKTWSDIVPG